MALRHVPWLAATLAVVATLVLIHAPTGRSTAPAATDVLFVFDTTGSMSDALAEAKAQATGVMSDLAGRLPNLRFGVAQLRDYGSTPVWQVEQGLGSDLSAVQAAIDSLSADEGGDSPEAYGTGLFQSRNDPAIGWASGAKHLVVLIADDVPHDDDLNAGVPLDVINQPSPWDTGTDPGPSGAGIDWQQELAHFEAAEYTLAFVLYHGVPAYLPYWDWWARLTGGQATESTSSTPLGDVLVDIVTETASTCRSDVEDDPPQCDADEAPAFSGELPGLAAEPDSVDSSDPDAPNEGAVPGTCPPGPVATSEPQGGIDPAPVTAQKPVAPPPDEWNCPHEDGEPLPAASAVTWREARDAIRFRNADGVWTIYKRCIDATVDGRRYTVGPGYVAQLKRHDGVKVVDDFRGRTDTWTPGYINAVNGGLGTFGWHHARGPVGATPAGDDPTTPAVEVGIGRTPQVIEGRMCAATNGGYGVYARNWYGPVRVSPTKINYTMDVWLRDQYGDTGEGPSEDAIARIRYRYTFYRSSVSLWALVTTYAASNAAGTPFVKEPKFTALTRGGGFVRMAVFNGPDGRTFNVAMTRGEPEGTAVLNTDHASDDTRKRVRWDYEAGPGEGTPGCSKTRPCLNVAARSHPVTSSSAGILRTEQSASWEGGGLGLDAWAVASASRVKSYPRDTRGDNVVSSCKTRTFLSIDDLDRNGRLDEYELAKASERTSTDIDQVREWELGGWKSGPNNTPYQAALTLFPGWENGRGGWDCEPLQRAFGSSGESWGSYFSYSLNDGWLLSG
jgi:hypothetical protein